MVGDDFLYLHIHLELLSILGSYQETLTEDSSREYESHELVLLFLDPASPLIINFYITFMPGYKLFRRQ